MIALLKWHFQNFIIKFVARHTKKELEIFKKLLNSMNKCRVTFDVENLK